MSVPVLAIINLAGENIGSSRWDEEKRQSILQSRIQICSSRPDRGAGRSSGQQVLIRSVDSLRPRLLLL